jgi:hypothetical protein
MKRAVMVVGPESSGTRLAARILVAAGVAGSDVHAQAYDWRLPTEPLILWRRSLPHRNEWPDIPCMVRSLHAAGYDVLGMFTDRADEPLTLSQMASRGRTRKAAARNIARARIIMATWPLPKVLVQYEDLVARPKEMMAQMLSPLHLPVPDGIEIFDANAKYETEEESDG